MENGLNSDGAARSQKISQSRYRFDKLEKFVAWYNDKKPHMSLSFNKAETPSEAFVRKMRTEVWFGFAKHWF